MTIYRKIGENKKCQQILNIIVGAEQGDLSIL